MFNNEKQKPVRIQVMVQPNDKEEIAAAADEAGMTISEYIRRAIKFYYESRLNQSNDESNKN